MKKIFTLSATLIAVLFLSGMAHAAKFRVNNSGVNGTYLQPTDAYNAASDGDTIYIESSPVPYGPLEMYKRLVVIGTGYFLSENDSTQANAADCKLMWLHCYAGSANSIITGITSNGGLVADDDNILVKRVRVLGTLVISANNIVATQSFINSVIFSENSVNFQMTNCVITQSPGLCINMPGTCSAIMKNNIFRSGHIIYNTTYENNILEGDENLGIFNCTVKRNMGTGVHYDTTGGNLNNVDMTTVFKYTGSSDGKYKLKPGSPAIGYGIGGVDCGIYGGPEPYVLSGMPTVPAIWQLNVSGTNVTVKAKSH
jgi:hypothetical protein